MKAKNTSIIILLLTSLLFIVSCGTILSEFTMSEWSRQPVIESEQEVLLEGLSHPWGMTWLRDGSMLITQRGGELLFASPRIDGFEEPVTISGAPEVFASGQGGLLDISLHPDYSNMPYIYLAYSAGDSSGNRTQVSRYRLNTDGPGPALTDGELIFANNEYKTGNQHFGSRMAWLDDQTMLISIGDGGNPPLRFADGLQREQAQEPTTLFGNVVRIQADGSIPADNPFAGREGFQPALFSIGNRNIQGLAVDSVTGRIWASEHGSRGGDELNLISGGSNYGWPLVSHSREYVSGAPVSAHRSLEGYADPQLVWIDTLAPSGLAVRGNTIYAGGLRSQSVHIITVNDRAQFVSEQTISIGQRVRDVRIGPDNMLYVLTDDSSNGRLLRMALP